MQTCEVEMEHADRGVSRGEERTSDQVMPGPDISGERRLDSPDQGPAVQGSYLPRPEGQTQIRPGPDKTGERRLDGPGQGSAEQGSYRPRPAQKGQAQNRPGNYQQGRHWPGKNKPGGRGPGQNHRKKYRHWGNQGKKPSQRYGPGQGRGRGRGRGRGGGQGRGAGQGHSGGQGHGGGQGRGRGRGQHRGGWKRLWVGKNQAGQRGQGNNRPGQNKPGQKGPGQNKAGLDYPGLRDIKIAGHCLTPEQKRLIWFRYKVMVKHSALELKEQQQFLDARLKVCRSWAQDKEQVESALSAVDTVVKTLCEKKGLEDLTAEEWYTSAGREVLGRQILSQVLGQVYLEGRPVNNEQRRVIISRHITLQQKARQNHNPEEQQKMMEERIKEGNHDKKALREAIHAVNVVLKSVPQRRQTTEYRNLERKYLAHLLLEDVKRRSVVVQGQTLTEHQIRNIIVKSCSLNAKHTRENPELQEKFTQAGLEEGEKQNYGEEALQEALHAVNVVLKGRSGSQDPNKESTERQVMAYKLLEDQRRKRRWEEAVQHAPELAELTVEGFVATFQEIRWIINSWDRMQEEAVEDAEKHLKSLQVCLEDGYEQHQDEKGLSEALHVINTMLNTITGTEQPTEQKQSMERKVMAHSLLMYVREKARKKAHKEGRKGQNAAGLAKGVRVAGLPLMGWQKQWIINSHKRMQAYASTDQTQHSNWLKARLVEGYKRYKGQYALVDQALEAVNVVLKNVPTTEHLGKALLNMQKKVIAHSLLDHLRSAGKRTRQEEEEQRWEDCRPEKRRRYPGGDTERYSRERSRRRDREREEERRHKEWRGREGQRKERRDEEQGGEEDHRQLRVDVEKKLLETEWDRLAAERKALDYELAMREAMVQDHVFQMQHEIYTHTVTTVTRHAEQFPPEGGRHGDQRGQSPDVDYRRLDRMSERSSYQRDKSLRPYDDDDSFPYDAVDHPMSALSDDGDSYHWTGSFHDEDDTEYFRQMDHPDDVGLHNREEEDYHHHQWQSWYGDDENDAYFRHGDEYADDFPLRDRSPLREEEDQWRLWWNDAEHFRHWDEYQRHRNLSYQREEEEQHHDRYRREEAMDRRGGYRTNEAEGRYREDALAYDARPFPNKTPQEGFYTDRRDDQTSGQTDEDSHNRLLQEGSLRYSHDEYRRDSASQGIHDNRRHRTSSRTPSPFLLHGVKRAHSPEVLYSSVNSIKSPDMDRREFEASTPRQTPTKETSAPIQTFILDEDDRLVPDSSSSMLPRQQSPFPPNQLRQQQPAIQLTQTLPVSPRMSAVQNVPQAEPFTQSFTSSQALSVVPSTNVPAVHRLPAGPQAQALVQSMTSSQALSVVPKIPAPQGFPTVPDVVQSETLSVVQSVLSALVPNVPPSQVLSVLQSMREAQPPALPLDHSVPVPHLPPGQNVPQRSGEVVRSSFDQFGTEKWDYSDRRNWSRDEDQRQQDRSRDDRFARDRGRDQRFSSQIRGRDLRSGSQGRDRRSNSHSQNRDLRRGGQIQDGADRSGSQIQDRDCRSDRNQRRDDRFSRQREDRDHRSGVGRSRNDKRSRSPDRSQRGTKHKRSQSRSPQRASHGGKREAGRTTDQYDDGKQPQDWEIAHIRTTDLYDHGKQPQQWESTHTWPLQPPGDPPQERVRDPLGPGLIELPAGLSFGGKVIALVGHFLPQTKLEVERRIYKFEKEVKNEIPDPRLGYDDELVDELGDRVPAEHRWKLKVLRRCIVDCIRRQSYKERATIKLLCRQLLPREGVELTQEIFNALIAEKRLVSRVARPVLGNLTDADTSGGNLLNAATGSGVQMDQRKTRAMRRMVKLYLFQQGLEMTEEAIRWILGNQEVLNRIRKAKYQERMGMVLPGNQMGMAAVTPTGDSSPASVSVSQAAATTTSQAGQGSSSVLSSVGNQSLVQSQPSCSQTQPGTDSQAEPPSNQAQPGTTAALKLPQDGSETQAQDGTETEARDATERWKLPHGGSLVLTPLGQKLLSFVEKNYGERMKSKVSDRINTFQEEMKGNEDFVWKHPQSNDTQILQLANRLQLPAGSAWKLQMLRRVIADCLPKKNFDAIEQIRQLCQYVMAEEGVAVTTEMFNLLLGKAMKHNPTGIAMVMTAENLAQVMPRSTDNAPKGEEAAVQNAPKLDPSSAGNDRVPLQFVRGQMLQTVPSAPVGEAASSQNALQALQDAELLQGYVHTAREAFQGTVPNEDKLEMVVAYLMSMGVQITTNAVQEVLTNEQALEDIERVFWTPQQDRKLVSQYLQGMNIPVTQDAVDKIMGNAELLNKIKSTQGVERDK